MLTVSKIARRFGDAVVLDGLDLTVERGEIVCVLGPSGCGKSTLLRLVGGLDRPSGGGIALGGKRVEGPSRDIGFVFQEPRLMPWLTVAENVAFGLWERPRKHRIEAATEVLARVGLAGFAGYLPRALSGGMAQRVAIARALVTHPALLLLDEPFSALDALTRTTLQDYLLEIWAIERPAMLFVTHDVDEAIRIADTILVMRAHPGRIRRLARLDSPRPRRLIDAASQTLKAELLEDLGGDEAYSV